jgi:hypothetical protein
MAKKEYFLIVDTETTANDTVFDFGAVVCDRKGNIVQKCAIIVKEELDKDLFFDPKAEGIWSRQYANKKKAGYLEMINNGNRMVASVAAVNRWLEKVAAKYNPTITAYNFAFDREKCAKTGIDLSMFNSSFCLWHLSCSIYAKTKAYRQFILDNHYFGNRTKFGNMTYKTNAEVMAHFVTGNYSEEPHTAIEDAQYYELPILVSILKKKGWKNKIGTAYNWKDYQLKDNFKA